MRGDDSELLLLSKPKIEKEKNVFKQMWIMTHVINRGRQRQSSVIDLPQQWEFSFSNKKSLSDRPQMHKSSDTLFMQEQRLPPWKRFSSAEIRHENNEMNMNYRYTVSDLPAPDASRAPFNSWLMRINIWINAAQRRRCRGGERRMKRGRLKGVRRCTVGGKLEKAARRRPAYSQMICLQVCAAPHIKSYLGLLDVGGWRLSSANCRGCGEMEQKWETDFFSSSSSPLSEEPTVSLKEPLTHWLYLVCVNSQQWSCWDYHELFIVLHD